MEDRGVDSTAVVTAALSVIGLVPVVFTCEGPEVVFNTAEEVLVSRRASIVK